MPKIIDHDQYRNELLSGSFEYFAEQGIGQVTMRELAKHLGVSTGTLYHYFASKEDIFYQLVEFQADQDMLLLANLPAPKRLAKRVELFLELIEQHRDYLTKQCFLWIDFGRQVGLEALMKKEVVAKAHEKYVCFLAQYLCLSDQDAITFVISYLSGYVNDPYLKQVSISLKVHGDLLTKALSEFSELK